MKKIAIIIAFNGLRDEEFFVPLDTFKKEGYKVDVFSWQKGEAVGKLAGKYLVKRIIEELDAKCYDAIVLIGGPGGYHYIGNIALMNILREANKENKIIGAICMAPQLVAESGLLVGKKATIFNGDINKLEKFGAIYTGRQVEEDGRMITADGPSSALLFANKIIERLKD